jgi:hypothetical protein
MGLTRIAPLNTTSKGRKFSQRSSLLRVFRIAPENLTRGLKVNVRLDAVFLQHGKEIGTELEPKVVDGLKKRGGVLSGS